MSDPSTADLQRALSVPAASIAGQIDRRAFLAGALAAAGTLSVLPSWFDEMAAAATPVGASEGILIVLQLGGGNDGFNTVVPLDDPAYTAKRGVLAVANALPLTAQFGLHPMMPKLKARYDAGKVAVVHGVGQATVSDLSHFSSIASWMAGTSGTDRRTGWLGRWLDGVPESAAGLRAVTMDASVPLHLRGEQAVVTSMSTDGVLFGSDRSAVWMAPVYDTLQGFAAAPTGKGTLADQLARAESQSLNLASQLTPIYSPKLPDGSLASKMTVMARMINANLGVRLFSSLLGSFDTHNNQRHVQNLLLAELDRAIDAFYQNLSPTWADRVTIMTFSEFGRRPLANASFGTDHGTSSSLFVIGDKVKGGMHGQAPRLDQVDGRGNPLVHVDHRSVYASVLNGWLRADPSAVLGQSYPDLGLFRAPPGAVAGTVATPVAGKPVTPSKIPTTLRGIRGTASVRGTVTTA